MKRIILLAGLGTLTACNTMQGFGEDLQEGGVAIEEAAEAAQYEEPQPQPRVRRAAPNQPNAANTYYY